MTRRGLAGGWCLVGPALNDNDKYDFGETFGDIPEPFFDVDQNGVRDGSVGSLETFVDGNGNNQYDVADGVYTGSACVGDNTVCDRTTLLIWQTRKIILSGSVAAITPDPANTFPGAPDTTTTFFFDIEDNFNHPMPDGTTVEIKVNGDGEVANPSINLVPGQTQITVTYTSPDPVGGGDSITIDVESPAGLITSQTFN